MDISPQKNTDSSAMVESPAKEAEKSAAMLDRAADVLGALRDVLVKHHSPSKRNKVVKRDVDGAITALRAQGGALRVSESRRQGDYRSHAKASLSVDAKREKKTADRHQQLREGSALKKNRKETPIGLLSQTAQCVVDLSSSTPLPRPPRATSSVSTLKKAAPAEQPPKSAPATKKAAHKPANGIEFTRNEAAEILAKVPDAGDAGALADSWIEKKLVPMEQRRSLLKLRRKKLNHPKVYLSGWGNRGRPATATTGQLKTFFETSTLGGNTVDDDALEKYLNSEKVASATARGESEATVKAPSRQTVKRAQAKALELKVVKEVHEVVYKSEARAAAEDSVRATAAHLATVAASSFLPGVRPRPGEAPTGELANLVREANGGGDLAVVRPSLLFSQDDTTYACSTSKGSHKKKTVRLMSPDEATKTRSPFSVDPTANANVARIRQHQLMAADGCTAPLVYSISGLSAAELPVSVAPSGVKIIEVEGYSTGAVADPTNKQPGYIAFLRSRDSKEDAIPDQVFFEWYNKTVKRPFITAQRAKLSREPIVEGTEIPDSLTASAWLDGALAQLAVLTSEESLAASAALKVVESKHHASRTTTEQPCDAGPVFRSAKGAAKTTNAQDSDYSMRLKLELKKLFVSNGVKLSPPKMDTLTDGLACMPIIQQSACKLRNVVDGFVSTGIITSPTNPEPNKKAILGTKRTPLMAADEKLILDNFPILLEDVYNYGMVREETFDRLGFPEDRDSTGKIVRRDATITQEWMQRSKLLSHAYQRALREARRAAADAKRTQDAEFNKSRTQVSAAAAAAAASLLSRIL